MSSLSHTPDRIWRYDSPLGPLTLASDGVALIGLWLDGQKYYGAGLSPAPTAGALPVFDAACRWLDAYFAGQNPPRLPPLAPRGTPFRQAVWRLLLAIPYGDTTSYGALAQRLSAAQGGHPVSARAVGGAVGHNPISILIPCHRVLGADGSLTGYAGGLEAKRALLELERRNRYPRAPVSAQKLGKGTR